jgi:hypothetical protein
LGGNTLVEHSDTFDLLAELAIAVAGFAGVASAFGGRDRAFGPAELVRLTALFQFSTLVLAGCFGLASLASAGVGARTGLGLVSFAEGVALLALAAFALPGAFRIARSEESTIGGWPLAFVVSVYVVAIPLCLANALLMQREWPLIVVFSILILQSLWFFFRLLTLRL